MNFIRTSPWGWWGVHYRAVFDSVGTSKGGGRQQREMAALSRGAATGGGSEPTTTRRCAIWWPWIWILGVLGCLAAHGAEPELPWSFHPIHTPPIPPVSLIDGRHSGNAVDAFVEARLRVAGITPNREANRRVLLRRLSFDLVGLPPSLEEIEAFEHDPDPEAWERQVERLLARPEHGERWARHWLDVMRFAQSNGYERDGEKQFAWRYRDYIVRSLNADKPYNQFVREHIAGDQLKPWSEDAVIATGYARLGILDDEPDDPEQAIFDELDDILSTTGTAFLGLTLGCARCHEHKFDPISHADYYKLLAFFRGVEPGRHVSELGKSTAHLPLASPQELAEWTRRRDARVGELEAELKSNGDDKQRKVIQGKLDAVRKEMPPFEHALGLKESPGEIKPTRVLKRGNPRTPAESVSPAVLLDGTHRSTTESEGGRRIVLADWIASTENPWTARVIVNRVWHHHFGVGIVKTTGDFGRAGSPPTHPELLDWLASEFMAHGWSLKWLHRQIVTSATYRRSSAVPSGETGEVNSALEKDPANTLLWRQNLRRLDAEVIRDSALWISGQLNRVPGGRGFFPLLSGEVLEGGSRPGTDWELSSDAERSRRSLYAYIRRTQAIPFFETLDYANYTSPLTERPTTTVAPQALMLLNDEFMHEQASALTRRIQKDLGAVGGKVGGIGHREFIQRAYQIALGRVPTGQESRLAEQFLERIGREFSRMDTRMLFRSRVPGTMNISYFDQLKARDFMVSPRGWEPRRGSWPDRYEGNQIMRRAAGPFAVWEGDLPVPCTVRGRLIPHTALEGGGVLLGGTVVGDEYRGIELLLEPREQLVALGQATGTNVIRLGMVNREIKAGLPIEFRARIEEDRIQVWLDQGGSGSVVPVLECQRPRNIGAGKLGIRAWGSALSVEQLLIESPRLPSKSLLMNDPENDPYQRALDTFCLMILNLNEVAYSE